jgi:aryl sulfotransferase
MDALPGFMWHLSDAWARRDQPNVLLVHYGNLSSDLAGQMRWLAGDHRGRACLARACPNGHVKSMSGRADTLVPTAGLFKSNAAFFRLGSSGAGREILSGIEMDAYHAAQPGWHRPTCSPGSTRRARERFRSRNPTRRAVSARS